MKEELKSKLCKREKKKGEGGGNNGKASQVVFEKRVFSNFIFKAWKRPFLL